MGRPLPSELRGKLKPIILRLAPSSDGEILAAAGKIDLLLRKNGLDWHDFADHAVADGAVALPSQSSAPQPAPAWGAGTGGRQIDAEQLRGIIEAIRRAGVWMSANSRQFIDGLECKAVAYPTVNLSERQHQWLHDLARAAAKV